MGVGDQVPPAIEQLGARVTLIDADGLAFGDLSTFDAIVTGVRAYERRPDLRANNHRLLDYAARGGTVIVQYNKFEFNEAQYGPYPGQGQLEPRHRRARAGAGARARSPRDALAEPDRRGRVAGLGAGARALFPRREGREVRRPRAARGPLPVQQGAEARRAGGRAGGQGPVDVRRPGPVAAAAGGHRGRVPAACQPVERGQGPARGGAAPASDRRLRRRRGRVRAGRVHGGPPPGARRRPRAGRRSRRVSPQQALRRGPDVARAEAVSRRRSRAAAHLHAQHPPHLHGSPRRRVGVRRHGRADRAPRPAHRIRQPADDAGAGSGRGASRTRRHHARVGNGHGHPARGPRRPRVRSANRRGRRRGLQHGGQAPRIQSPDGPATRWPST